MLAINTAVVIATGYGAVMNNATNQLADFAGEIKLTDDWAKNLLRQIVL